MKIKRWFTVLILGLMTLSEAYGQPSAQPTFPAPAALYPDGVPARQDDNIVPTVGGLSDWVLGRRDCCEGRHGRVTPLYTEFYLEAGPSFPTAGATLSRELQTGWSIAGGLRALFFDEALTRAWVVDGHIINTNESAGRLNTPFPVTVYEKGAKTEFGAGGLPGATLQNANRTMVGVGLGREWYLWKPADFDGAKWRVGVDAGGRYGSLRVNLNEFGHLTDVAGGIYSGVHADVEKQCGTCLVHVGVRFEWSYTWSDVLQRTSDVQDLHLMLTAGIRY